MGSGFGGGGRFGLGRRDWARVVRDGEGIVLPGLGGDEGPQGGVGCEDAVVTVAVDPGRGEDFGEAVDELQGRDPEGGTARRIGRGELGRSDGTSRSEGTWRGSSTFSPSKRLADGTVVGPA
jgi:hypothetical protein